MTQSTYFNQVKNVLKVLQGYTKGIRFIALLTMLALGAGNAWGAGTWTLVKDASTLTAGDKVIIVAKDNDFAMSTTQNTNNRGQVAVTKNGETLTYTTAVQELTLKDGKTSGTLAFYTGSGYLYAASSSKNYLKTETTLSANSSWTITIANTGAATIKATGSNTRNWLRYNSSNNPPIFSCYSSGQSDVCLYKYVEEQGGDEGGGETPDPTPSKLSTPANLKEASIAETSATLSWDAVANASNYSVTINGNTATANSNSYSATGLTAGTAYTWSVVAKGDGTNYTDSDAAQHTFTTTAATTPDPGTGGEALSYTWDLSKKTYSAASDTQVTWSATDVNMVADKGTAGTAPNNYLGGDANNRTSSRFYQNSILTITPEANVTITSVVFTATSTNYATALKGSTWTNATASANNTTVTVTPTDGTTAISAKIGGTCGFTGVTVNYTKAASDVPEPVIVKTLKSIAVTGMTTTFEQGDVFKFDGTCTATYSVTKDGVAQADETAEVTPTSVSTPNMNTIGNQTVTVTYSEGGADKTDEYEITITENTVTAGEYCIAPNNDFWGTNFSGSITGDALNQTYIGRQDDITIQYAKGSGSNLYINDSQTRTYSGTTLTFSVPSGYLITAIAFTADGNNWDGTHTANAGSMTDSKNWAGSANEVTITFGGTCRITNICVTYEAIDLTLPSAPTFTPAAGTYNAVQNVTISAEAGTTIYYTLDGTEPTTESNVYASAIEISETTTVKAIAVKDEKVSPVASATYTINLPLTTMDQIFAKATAVGSTATSVEITFGNWVVSAVKEDGKTAYVTDGTKGFIIYTASHGFLAGDILSGTVACKVQLYNGSSELTELTKTTEGLTVTTGGTVTPVEVDDVNTLGGVNTGSVIKITGTCESGNVVAGVKLYGTLYTFDNLTVGNKYNVTGVYLQYGEVEEILPRKQEDIEEVIDIPTATISIADITMEVGETKTIEATITPDAAQSTVQYAITSGSEYITLNGTTITAVAAGTATITATIAEVAGEYYGATETFTVTVPTTYDVTWMVNGDEWPTTEVVEEGKRITTLPEEPTDECGGKTFVGWSNQEVTDGNKPAVLFTDAANSPIITDQTTFHAVFADKEGDGESGWQKVIATDEVVDGGIFALLTYDEAYYLANAQSTSDPLLQTVTKQDGKITVTDEMKWRATAVGGGFTFTSYNNPNYYLWGAHANDGIRINTESTKQSPTNVWSIELSNDYGVVLYHNASIDGNKYLSTYGDNDWRNYLISNINENNRVANLYKEYIGSTYSDYTTSCLDVNWTITEGGSLSTTSGITTTIIPNEGYTYGEPAYTITDGSATVTQNGNIFTAVPTTDCTIQINMVQKTTYTVTWMVNGLPYTIGTPSTTVYADERVTTLPTPPNPNAYCGDVFVGWTDAENGAYNHGISKLYTTLEDFPPATDNQTFYAVFADYEQQ